MVTPVALLKQVRLDLLCSHHATTDDFKAFLASRKYTPTKVGKDSLQLCSHGGDELVSALAGDCSKFGRAACETIAGLITEPRAPKNAAWLVIRSYYAAFYCAHAFLRLFGRTCTYIDGAELAKLKEAVIASGHSAPSRGHSKPSRGFYKVTISRDKQSLDFKKLNNSHEDTWASVYELLDELRDAAATVVTSKASRDETVELLSDIIDTMSDDGKFNKGNYLSYFRNQVQYRFAGKAWYPYGSREFPPSISAEDIAKSVLGGRFQRLTGSSEIVKFLNASLEFAQLTLNLVDHSAERGPEASTHLHRDYKRIRNIYA